MAKAVMIQGTGSGAGKSLLAAGLCRILSDMGIKVAPFKSQNMALNSYITIEGGEIGRAQALQAEACRVEPSVHMNPVLLKTAGEKGCQVIIHGRVRCTMKAKEYYAFKKTAWEAVKESYDRLSADYDVVVIEGAGSPAEINLSDVEIVNMAVARYASAPVVLVGDIDHGGVFASLYGTVKLLEDDADFIKAFVINKFRGDLSILEPGLEMIREKTGVPVIGVLPYITDIGLPEEDGLALYRGAFHKRVEASEGSVRIVIVKLKSISNFTDFDAFSLEPDAEVVYSLNPSDIKNADLVILPGSKNTVSDLLELRRCGLDRVVMDASESGAMTAGICGGYQMMGRMIRDPHLVESSHPEIPGLGLLDVETDFNTEKTTCRTDAEFAGEGLFSPGAPNEKLHGYEIHMGASSGDTGILKFRRHTGDVRELSDGSVKGDCWGTYLHGIFDDDRFRRRLLNTLRQRKGLEPLALRTNFIETKEAAINGLASAMKTHLDIDFIKRIAGI